MKKIIMSILMVVVAITAFSQVPVRERVRTNGTYVPPYVYTAPLGNPYNNPSSGTITGGNPDTYLYNYSNMRSPRTIYSYFNRPARTLPSYTYDSLPDEGKIKDNKGRNNGRKRRVID